MELTPALARIKEPEKAQSIVGPKPLQEQDDGVKSLGTSIPLEKVSLRYPVTPIHLLVMM